jgi:WD40 repeat protein
MIQFEGHSAAVTAVAFAPDSGLLATASRDGTVRLWDVFGGRAGEFPIESVREQTLSWAPGGGRLVYGGEYGFGEYRLTGERTELHGMAVTGVCHLTDDLLIIGGPSGVDFFDVSRKAVRLKQPPQRAVKKVQRLAVNPEAKLVAWTTVEHRLQMWKLTSPDKVDVALAKPSWAVAVSPDGQRVAVGVDYAVRLFRAGGKHPDAELTGHTGRVSGAAFDGTGRTLATSSWDGTVRVWDVESAREVARFPLSVGQLTAIACSPDGTRLAVGGTAGGVVLIDVG